MIVNRDFVRSAMLGGLVGLLAGVAVVAAPAAAEDKEARIENFTFVPQRLTVKAGTTVTWINADDIPHAIASITKAFKLKVVDTNDKRGNYGETAGIHGLEQGLVGPQFPGRQRRKWGGIAGIRR